MESHANSVEDYLIEGLSFKLTPGASYINQRRSVSFFPQGGNSYAPNGVRVIKMSLTGDQWLDPATIRIMFDLTNNATEDPGHKANLADKRAYQKYLRPISGPWSFFRRMRILCGGQVIEDIDQYNACHEMFSNLRSYSKAENDMIEGFGQAGNILRCENYHPTLPRQNCFTFGGIYPGDTMTVTFKPLSGIFNQPKYLPLRYMNGLTIEFEVVSDPNDPVVYPSIDNNGSSVQGHFSQACCSNNWVIGNVQCKCDLVQLDNGLENEYAQHLLSGKALPISYDTYVYQFQVVPSSNFSCNIARSFTRLKSAFVTLNKVITGSLGSDSLPVVGQEMRKSWNNFYHPSEHSDDILSSDQVEFQIQVGSRLFPEYPCRSLQEAFSMLSKTLGISPSAWHGVNIIPEEWRDNKFVFAVDFEKVLEAGFSGLNTKAGDLMTIKINQRDVPTLNLATGMRVILHSDNILNIRDTGVEVFD